MIKWQDVLDLIAAGRPEGLTCPFCQQGIIQIKTEGRVTKVTCPSCRRFVEGSFPGD